MRDANGWAIVKKLERERRRETYRDMPFSRRLEIYDDMYETVLKLAPEKIHYSWPGDDNWHKIPHLKNLIETRKLLNATYKKTDSD